MPIKKVLFITPPAFTRRVRDINPLPPMGPAYLGAVLEKEGIEVKILDSLIEGWEREEAVSGNIIKVGLSFQDIEKKIVEFGPDMVGISCLFTKQRKNAHEIARIVKATDKKVFTVMGGAHPSVCPELVLDDDNIDFVILGEGESTIRHLINHLNGNKSLGEVDGIGYRSNGEKIIRQRVRFIQDLDSLPFPARHLLDMEAYFGLKSSHGTRKKDRFSPIITSRGCPAKCTFCSAHKVWGRAFRKRTPKNVIKEMIYLKERYGIEELLFEDDNTTLDVQRAGQIFDMMIVEGLNFSWDTPNGVAAFALTKKLIKKMIDSGCYSINLALESGNQEHLLRNIKKPLKLDRIPPLVNYVRELGCDVGLFLVLGMPGETEEMMWDSFRLANKLRIYTPHISIATPYPGSELFNICVEKGYLKEDFDLDDLYIRSFSITTPEWDGRRLREIYVAGKRWLLLQHLKHEPVSFSRTYVKRLWPLDLARLKHMSREMGLIN